MRQFLTLSTNKAQLLPSSSSSSSSALAGNNLDLLSEMIFGAIPIQIKAENTKIHVLQSSKQIVITKLFQVSVPSSWIDPLFADRVVKFVVNDIVLEKDDDEDVLPVGNNNNNHHHLHNKQAFRSSINLARQGAGASINNGGMRRSHSRTGSLDNLAEHELNSGARGASSSKQQQQHHMYTCKSMFALGFVITFHDDIPIEIQQQLQQQASGNNNNTLNNSSYSINLNESTSTQQQQQQQQQTPYQTQINQLHKLIFSNFEIFELRFRKLMKNCTVSIRNSLRQAIIQVHETGNLKKTFHGVTFNIKLLPQALQADMEVLKASKDLFRFVHSFFAAPRLEVSVTKRFIFFVFRFLFF